MTDNSKTYTQDQIDFAWAALHEMMKLEFNDPGEMTYSVYAVQSDFTYMLAFTTRRSFATPEGAAELAIARCENCGSMGIFCECDAGEA